MIYNQIQNQLISKALSLTALNTIVNLFYLSFDNFNVKMTALAWPMSILKISDFIDSNWYLNFIFNLIN